MREPRVGIVGGSGYIGSVLADYLSSVFTVKVIDKNPSRSPKHNIGYKRCDIVDYSEIKEAVDDVQLIIHAAIVQIPLINTRKKLGYEVNFLGTQNVCRAVDETPSVKGMILAGTWHVFGEQELDGIIDEAFGFRPDKVEDRTHLYALSKIAQELIVRYYDEISEKVYGVIRMGTVLGKGMPEKTAASIFISKGLMGESITPFKHSMYRPMLYVDINDVCRAYKLYALKILNGEIRREKNGLAHVVNLCWPNPITIIELAGIIQNTITKLTEEKVKPKIEIVDKCRPVLYEPTDKHKVKVDISKVRRFLGIAKLTDPERTIERIVRASLAS